MDAVEKKSKKLATVRAAANDTAAIGATSESDTFVTIGATLMQPGTNSAPSSTFKGIPPDESGDSTARVKFKKCTPFYNTEGVNCRLFRYSVTQPRLLHT